MSYVITDQQALCIKHEIMPPGSSETLHHHEEAQQQFYIIRGRATFKIQSQTIQLQAHEQITIEPPLAHLIQNEGMEDLEFILVSQPSTQNDRIEIL